MTDHDKKELTHKQSGHRKGRVKIKVDHEQYVDLGKVVEVRNVKADGL